MAQFLVDPDDVVESFIRSPGPGGQNVNKVATCVVLWHKPTRIKIKCHVHRSQALNRAEAWRLLAEALAQRKRQAEADRRHAKEKVRRQNRKLSLNAKEKMLKDKKRHAQLKIKRAKTVDWE